MVTEKEGVYHQIGIIHGSLAKCTNKFPGIFVRLDDPKIFDFIQKELSTSTLSRSQQTTLESTSVKTSTGNKTDLSKVDFTYIWTLSQSQ